MDDYYERYDKLKSAYEFLNRQMSQFENTTELQRAEYTLIKEIGEYTHASVVHLTSYKQGNYFLASMWKQNEKSNKKLYQDVKIRKSLYWMELFLQGKSVYIEDVDKVCEELYVSRDELKKNGISSIYVFPLLQDNKVMGLISIGNANKRKIEEIEEIHEVLGNWLVYRLIKKDNQIQKILSGLGRDYTAAYMINIDTETFEIILNQKTNNAAKESKRMKWDDYLYNYADKYVLSPSKEVMKEKLSCAYLCEYFEKEEDLQLTFETVANAIGQTYFQAHGVKEYESEGRYIVIGFRCIDEIVKMEREHSAELDKAYQLVQQQLDIVTSAIPGGIKISNDDDTYSFKYVSEQYARMLGYETPDELIEASNGSIVGIAHPDDLESGISEALKQYEKADYYDITYRMRCKDGTYKYIEDHGHKFIRDDGDVEHWNLILDKNELVEKTIQLEAEKKANVQKSTFLSKMSHDMRTPLNGMIGLLEICDRHPDDKELIHASRQKAMICAKHLLSLINDTLEFSKLDQQDFVIYEESVNIDTLMNDIFTITKMRADQDGISITYDRKTNGKKEAYLLGNELYIEQIFINIITNAIKYNKPAGNVHCLIYESFVENEKVDYDVTIEDTGIGISNDFLDKIFTPFMQADKSSRSEYMGTGLGMAIVKNLIDRMGGTIDIHSTPGVGTKVHVSLSFPLVPQKEMNREDIDVNEVDFEGIRILLAEDNELNREIAKYVLEERGLIVTEVFDGKQAYELYKANPAYTYDLILMDIMMPEMNGIEATKAIRHCLKEDATSIPIFAMTANAFSEDKKNTHEAGMNEHLSKPLNMNEMLKLIYQYCRKVS